MKTTRTYWFEEFYNQYTSYSAPPRKNPKQPQTKQTNAATAARLSTDQTKFDVKSPEN